MKSLIAVLVAVFVIVAGLWFLFMRVQQWAVNMAR